MNKKQIIKQLNNEIENLKGGLNNISVDFYDDKKHYLNQSNYICDEINEFADSNIDIYTYNLFDWAKTNYNYIEQGVAEFGIDEKNFDFIKLIQQGQYLQLTQDLYNDIDEIIKMFAFYEMIEQINDLTNDDEIEIEIDFDEFENEIENLDSNNYFDDIVELVTNTLTKNIDDDK